MGAQRVPKKIQWEYTIILWKIAEENERPWSKMMSDKGDDGWEAYAVTSTSTSYTVYFKRQK